MSFHKKLARRMAPSPKKLTPGFVKKSEVLTKAATANIAFRAVKQNSMIAKTKNLRDIKTMRADLRALHETSTSPFSKTSNLIYERDKLPPGDPERERLTAQINAATLQRGRLGIAVGGTVVGGVAGSAIAKGGAALTRENPPPSERVGSNTWFETRNFPDPQRQMYSQYPQGAPSSMTRSPNVGAPAGGVLSKVVYVFWQLLAPKAKV